jgi:hypothetical protein
MSRKKLRIVPLSNTSDLGQDRIDLSTGFSIRDISLTEETFRLWDAKLSREDLTNLLSWDLCVVHEFQSDLVIGHEELTSSYLMRFVVAALRWIWTTETTDTWFVQGFLTPKDVVTISSFVAKPGTSEALTTPQFAARRQHIFVEDFEARAGLANPVVFGEVATLLPRFDKIVKDMILHKDSYVPIIMATRLCEQAYLEFDVYIRFLRQSITEFLWSRSWPRGSQRGPMSNRRDNEFARALEANETAIKEVVDCWSQQKTIFPMEALPRCWNRATACNGLPVSERDY